MKTIKETDLTDFEFWGGATQYTNKLTRKEFKELSYQLEELYPDGLTETEINDLFWFDIEFICELLQLNEEDILNRISNY